MKRENYTIRWLNNRRVKHAFNSSVREIEKLIGRIANKENQTYILTHSLYDKANNTGSRTWQGENGNTITFTIEVER